jgi:hypothetical protein
MAQTTQTHRLHPFWLSLARFETTVYSLITQLFIYYILYITSYYCTYILQPHEHSAHVN